MRQSDLTHIHHITLFMSVYMSQSLFFFILFFFWSLSYLQSLYIILSFYSPDIFNDTFFYFKTSARNVFDLIFFVKFPQKKKKIFIFKYGSQVVRMLK